MKLQLIAVTKPDFFPEEAEVISRLLLSGVINRVHIRKPGCKPEEMYALIKRIPSALHSRLSLHDCHEIAVEQGCGIHLNSRNPFCPANFRSSLSRSCHKVSELWSENKVDYQFLSPIYPSISKKGYFPEISTDSLKGSLAYNTVALGGVTPDKFKELREIGFGGAALLGYIWESVNNNQLDQLIDELKCYNS